MRSPIVWACLLLLAINAPQILQATTWNVGPSYTYKTPCAVANLVNANDTVLIEPATYVADVCHWYDDNLYISGHNGMAVLDANFTSAGGKAIWVIKGKNCTVEHVEFTKCTVPDQNGAGIRAEGEDLTLRYCYFHHNEMGILTSNDGISDFLFEYCEFANNGYGDGYSHNIYVGKVNSLTMRYCYSHASLTGHCVKSRAKHNYLYYNRVTDEEGEPSYTIDLPNGGQSVLIGNLIQQGPDSPNGGIISYGAEGLENPVSEFVMVNNTVVNQKGSGTFVYLKSGTALFKAWNNLFLGPGTWTNGTATTIDTAYNWRLTDINAAGLEDYPNFNYRLTQNSWAVDKGADPGTYADTIDLTPTLEYLHPTNHEPRTQINTIDMGCYEYCQIDPIISPQNNTACQNTSATYSTQVINGALYNWTVTNGSILSGQGTATVTILWGNSGPGAVDVTITAY
ncbi:MAG: right-handed parallel beta-helix repeat-containing protein [Sphingobacteriales bacterium]|nr:right-handed parallel beta-helix repeat-containing protein [Sphingobacteriales bacterium]MBP9140844.1 right-handed parallel beta-helix repeat-containing protein [Chitinophagales bacterium]MDA0199196.1 right-handed parallel beta-helix repeat-containing protein [Bacteroidota bacterium]MBK6891174.1 right-handed parallel beta-helix repeat-containing protein [Sphingobacteriales bacterium]MBK7527002.1 right-handed parallel beta-helix repeat-containing protein [Sphingobacteriales bacterium]